MKRTGILLLLVYLSLDLGNPFVGGAFRFEAEESIEAARLGREGHPAARLAPDAVPNARLTQAPLPVTRRTLTAERPAVARTWLASRRQAFAVRVDSGPRSPGDGH